MQPRTRSRSGDPVHGSYRDQFIANPAAGKDWSYQLPGGYAYRIGLGFATLTCSAQVAKREPGFQVLDGDGLVRYRTSGRARGEAAAVIFVGYSSDGPQAGGGEGFGIGVGIPSLILPAGWEVGSWTGAIQTEDQYSTVRLWIEQLWDTDPHAAPGGAIEEELELHIERGAYAA